MTPHEQYRDDLPLYAVGALTAEESEQMKRHLAGCSECVDELRAFSEAAAQVALAVEPAAPPKRLRELVLAELRTPLTSPSVRRMDANPARPSRPWTAWFWIPAFTAAVLAIVSVALWRYDQQILGENQHLVAQLAVNSFDLRRAREVINTLTATDAQHAALVATGAKPQPEAKTIYSPQQRNLVLVASNLQPLPPHKAYELWLLPANGAAPVAAGTFMPDAGGSATLLLSQFGDGVSAKAFAVTIENEAGASVPTMPIVLSGTT